MAHAQGDKKHFVWPKRKEKPRDSPLTLSSVSPEYKALMADAYINIFILNPALCMPHTDAQCGGCGAWRQDQVKEMQNSTPRGASEQRFWVKVFSETVKL